MVRGSLPKTYTKLAFYLVLYPQKYCEGKEIKGFAFTLYTLACKERTSEALFEE